MVRSALVFAGRRPELVHRLILGNTFAWPADKGMAAFSRVVGNPLARFLIRRYNTLAKWLIPAGTNRKLTAPELAAYMGPFATPCGTPSDLDLCSPDSCEPRLPCGSRSRSNEAEGQAGPGCLGRAGRRLSST